MSRLTDQLQGQGKSIEADPLPEALDEGDSSDTDTEDENDTAAGVPKDKS